MKVVASWLAPLFVLPALAATGDEVAAETGLFASEQPLALTIEAPWAELTRRPEAGLARRGRLHSTAASGEPVAIDARVVVRGKSRLELCPFPMLTLELDRAQVAGSLFEADPVVHLTTQCGTDPETLQLLELELLAYRVFALVSERALRTRRLDVRVVRPGHRRWRAPRHAFLVEDIGLAAAKAGLRWVRPSTVAISELDAEARALFVIFQFMIGNTDWSLTAAAENDPCCHNTAMLGGASAGLVPVPFDLDSSGLVGAPYGAPHPKLGIRSTRIRLYRGSCDLEPLLETAIARFETARPAIFTLFENSELLNRRSRLRAMKYLKGFFEILGDPKRYEREILSRCLGS